MKTSELIRKLRRRGRKAGVSVEVYSERGKGSHLTVSFGDRLAVVPNTKKELKTGLLRAVLKQLGIDGGPDAL